MVFLRHKQGRRTPVWVRVQPLFGIDGSIIGGVELFSEDTAPAETRRKIQELEGFAFLDPLTVLPNRRYMEIALQTALNEFQVHKYPFGVLSIDLDRFKEINDRNGHIVGDQVLKETARTLRGALRSTDILGRWGGDEFIAIVRYASDEVLKSLAERCVALVRETAVPLPNREKLSASASIGATIARVEDLVEDLLCRADEQLYRSKTAGRGCVNSI